ncbi:MAG: ABC transporter substrate-binding protein [Bifidobacterium sp.]|nr:ABC transporter substrate-binding protein [Bifidobacterium sp.]
MRVVRKALAAATLLAALATLSGCGAAPSAGEAVTTLTYPQIELGATGKDLETTIVFTNSRTDMALDDYWGKRWKDYVAEFNELYPGIHVDVQTDAHYSKNSPIRLQAKDGSWDIMTIPDNTDKSEYADYFVPYGTVDTMDRQIKLADAAAYDGETYGVPTDLVAAGMLYNKRVFREAGVDDLPRTPAQYHRALKRVKARTDAIPLYTNYADAWAVSTWNMYAGVVATGDDTYLNQVMPHVARPFARDAAEPDTHPYALYKILYDAVADGLTEDDYSTTDWNSAKEMLNEGRIATIVIGPWAVGQTRHAGAHPEDVAYMPFPMTVRGKQYANLTPNYSMAVNRHVPRARQEAAMIFVKWMTERSGFYREEEGIPTQRSNGEMPALYGDFDGVAMRAERPATGADTDLSTDVSSDSELGVVGDASDAVRGIVSAAATGAKSYDEVMDDWNDAWEAAVRANAGGAAG